MSTKPDPTPANPAAKPTPLQIADRVVDGILAHRLQPGQRLGEQELADVFGVSRTLVREAMARLSARGMVEVSSRRGWFVVQPSPAAAAEAFEARVAVETGLLQGVAAPLPPERLARLRAHHRAERAALRRGDAGERAWLLGDFHVCLAECAGGPLLADILRDLTARTALVAALSQSTHDAERSCDEHAAIIDALERGDGAGAAAAMRAHIGGVAADLGSTAAADPLTGLCDALRPAPEAPGSPRRRLFRDLVDAPAVPAAPASVARRSARPSTAPSPTAPRRAGASRRSA